MSKKRSSVFDKKIIRGVGDTAELATKWNSVSSALETVNFLVSLQYVSVMLARCHNSNSKFATALSDRRYTFNAALYS